MYDVMQIKTHYKQYILEAEGHDRSCTTPESLVMGAIAGGAAALFSNPLDVITVRLMSQGPQKRYHGFRHCFLETVKQEGIGGLYKGGLCRILATMPYSGIAFGVYEGIKRLFFEGELEEFDLEDV
jgi:solute carrier family 25 aspartate/glutamate transporter 12/13